MNTERDRAECPEADLAAAQARIRLLEDKLCEAEQELRAAGDIIDEQGINIECLRLQLEAAEVVIDEAAETRRKLERRIADLEDAGTDEPCPLIVPVPQEQAPPQQPGYPPGYKPKPLVEAMIGQFRSREKK
jgi:septal ring factor EnvC (AmiA/AmiB activator)